MTNLTEQEQALLLGNDTIWLLLTGINILLMQVGFTAFESGAARAKHVKSVLFKNFLDHSIGAIVWFFVGWGIFSGNDSGFGMGSFGDPTLNEYPKLFQQFGFAATASTIISGAVSGRLRLEAYIFLSMLMCGLTYPIQAHWMWSAHGWLKTLGFRDFAGSCVVHVFGGACAFAAAFMAGSRPGRFQYQRRRRSSAWQKPAPKSPAGSEADDIETQSTHTPIKDAPSKSWRDTIKAKLALLTPPLYDAAPMPPAGNSLIMVVGALLLYISWFSFNAGSSGSAVAHSYQSARAAINTLLASGAGCTAFFFRSACKRNPKKKDSMYNLERACNSLLISLVAITGPCGYVHPWSAVLCGAFAAVFVLPFGDFVVLQICGVDDTLGAVAVHLFGGMFGSFWLGLTHPDFGAFYTGQGGFFGVQLLAVLLSTVFGFASTVLILLPFKLTKTLAYSTEEQLLGVDFLHFGGEDGRDMDMDSDSKSTGDVSDLESLMPTSTNNTNNVTSLNEPMIILTPPTAAAAKPHVSDLEGGSVHSTTLSIASAEGRREAGNQLKRALDDEDPRIRRRFRAYLQVLHAGESVEFWDEVNKWKRIRSEKKRVKESVRIINTYCLDESKTQVNLKSPTVVKMREALADQRMLARTDLFEDCLDELFKDLKQSFVQFVEKTPNYWL